MRVFTSLLTPDEARDRYWAQLRLAPTVPEPVALSEALDRVLAEDIVATEDLPAFDRSAVDGFAVRAEDLTGVDAGHPAGLRLVGDVRMGEGTTLAVRAGEAVRVPTGGMLPAGADAVVMQEYARATYAGIEVTRPLRRDENVVFRGEDLHAGEPVLGRGHRLRPQDLGILAALGRTSLAVRKWPRVAIFSSGNELVPPSAVPGPGQLRDANADALAGQVRRAGGEPVMHAILPDDLDVVTSSLRRALPTSELVLISGGSSVGERDVVVDAIQTLGPPGIIVHGVAIKPGKPVVLAVCAGRPVIGLPGNPVSAMVIFDVFARPVLEALLEMPERRFAMRVHARIAGRLAGAGEREEHVRVALEARDGALWARPLPPKSGLLTSMVRADGIVVVKPGAPPVADDELVEVALLR